MKFASIFAIATLSAVAAVDFDFYVLSQSWQPAFCAFNNDGSFSGCENPTDFMKSHLTIHGLWPNKNNGQNPDGTKGQCGDAAITSDDIEKAGLQDVNKYWPDVKNEAGSVQFTINEFEKHGRCSNLDGAQYVTAALLTDVKIDTHAIISNNVGKSIAPSSLRTAYNNQASFVCKNGYLSEVRTCWVRSRDNTPGNQIPCPPSVMKQDSCGKTARNIQIMSFQ